MPSKRDHRVNVLDSTEPAVESQYATEEVMRAFYGLREAETALLTVHRNGNITMPNITLTPVGIDVQGKVEDDKWLELGKLIKRLEGSLQWLIGDWVNGCAPRWGKTYLEVIETTGYDYHTVKDYAYVAHHVQLSVRTDKLSFGHHKLVAALRLPDGSSDVENQSYWLQRAVENQWSIAALRAALRSSHKPLPKSFVSPKFDRGLATILKEYVKLESSERQRAIQYVEQLLDEMRKRM
jgi:hypothetical protein